VIRALKIEDEKIEKVKPRLFKSDVKTNALQTAIDSLLITVTCSLSDHDFCDALWVYSQLLVDHYQDFTFEINNQICEQILKIIDDLNSRVIEKWNLVTYSKKVGASTVNMY